MNTESIRKPVATAILQDLKQHRVNTVETLLDGGVRAHHFHDELNQPTVTSILFSTFADLYFSASGSQKEVDAEQVFSEVAAGGFSSEADSLRRVFYSMNGDGRAFQADRAVPLIHREWKTNTLRRKYETYVELLKSGEDPDRISNESVTDILSVGAETERENIFAGDAVQQDLIDGVPTAVSSGSPLVDAIGGGGYPGQVHLYVGPSGHGKSSIATDSAAWQIRQGKYCVLIQEEMKPSVQRTRIMCHLAHVKMWQLRDYGKENWLKLFEANKALGLNEEVLSRSEEEIILYCRGEMNKYLRVYGSSKAGVRSIVRRHKAEWGLNGHEDNPDKVLWLWWDHMGYRVPENMNGTSMALKQVAMDTVQMALEEQAIVVSFSQPGYETRKHLLAKGYPDEDPQAALSSELRNASAHFVVFVRHNGLNDEGELEEDALGRNLTKFFLTKDRFEGLQNMVVADYDRDHFSYKVMQASDQLGVPA